MMKVGNPNQNSRHTNYRWQRGFDLIQLSIVTAITAVLIAGSLKMAPYIMQSVKLDSEITDLVLFQAKMKDIFEDGRVAALSLNDLKKLDVIPSEWQLNTGATQIDSTHLGKEGKIDLNAVNNEIKLSINYSFANCPVVVQGVKGIFNEIRIGTDKIAENGKMINVNKCAGNSSDLNAVSTVDFIFKP